MHENMDIFIQLGRQWECAAFVLLMLLESGGENHSGERDHLYAVVYVMKSSLKALSVVHCILVSVRRHPHVVSSQG